MPTLAIGKTKTLTVGDPVIWRRCVGAIAHALGRRYKSDLHDRPICGAHRYDPPRYSAEIHVSLRCKRCEKILDNAKVVQP